AALFRWPATIVRDRGHVDDAGHPEAGAIERTHRCFPARTRPLDPHFQILDTVLCGAFAGTFRRHLSRERRALARATEAAAAGSAPGQHVALAIGDRDDGVVECCVHEGDAVGDIRARTRLARASGGTAACCGHIILPELPDAVKR